MCGTVPKVNTSVPPFFTCRPVVMKSSCERTGSRNKMSWCVSVLSVDVIILSGSIR